MDFPLLHLAPQETSTAQGRFVAWRRAKGERTNEHVRAPMAKARLDREEVRALFRPGRPKEQDKKAKREEQGDGLGPLAGCRVLVVSGGAISLKRAELRRQKRRDFLCRDLVPQSCRSMCTGAATHYCCRAQPRERGALQPPTRPCRPAGG